MTTVWLISRDDAKTSEVDPDGFSLATFTPSISGSAG